MNNTVIALFMAAGVAAFVYSKFGRRTGDTKSTLTLVGVVFVVTFVVFEIIARMLINN